MSKNCQMRIVQSDQRVVKINKTSRKITPKQRKHMVKKIDTAGKKQSATNLKNSPIVVIVPNEISKRECKVEKGKGTK